VTILANQNAAILADVFLLPLAIVKICLKWQAGAVA